MSALKNTERNKVIPRFHVYQFDKIQSNLNKQFNHFHIMLLLPQMQHIDDKMNHIIGCNQICARLRFEGKGFNPYLRQIFLGEGLFRSHVL